MTNNSSNLGAVLHGAPVDMVAAPPDLNDTILLAAKLHDGEVDKLGAPYYFHAMRVMMRLGAGAADAEKHAALLHDVVEDNSEVTLSLLRALGYGEDILAILGLLTREQPATYPEFIDRLVASGNLGAMRIKLADLYDNTYPERMHGAPEEVRERLLSMAANRYVPAIAKLKLALGPLSDTVISGCVPVAQGTDKSWYQ